MQTVSLKLAVRGQLLEHRLQLLVAQLLPRLRGGVEVVGMVVSSRMARTGGGAATQTAV